MSKIMKNLLEIKKKIKENLASKKEEVELNSIDDNTESVESYFESVDKIIYLNIGGQKISRIVLKYILRYPFILSIKADITKVNINNKNDPFFIDICLDVWETLYDIIRLNPITNVKTEFTMYTNAEIDILEFEGNNLFGEDWKTITRKVKFIAKNISQKSYDALNQYNELGYLDKKYPNSVCCFCNTNNKLVPKLNKILITDESIRNVINKNAIFSYYYLSCVNCDPNKNRPIITS